MKKIKWGIIGLGDIAHQFASQFESAHAELAAVGSRTLQKAFDFSDKHGINKAYGSYQELAYDPEIDIVYVATPNSSHYKDMLMLLKAGKHVFCEKPIALNQKQLSTVLALADKKNLLVAEAMTIYHMPLFKELKNTIQTGKYGKVLRVHASFGIKPPFDPANRFYSPELGGGALLDIGVYPLSFIRYFLSSQPDAGSTTVKLNSTGVDEESTFSFSNRQGEVGTASLSFRSRMSNQGVIVCENARITVSNYPRATCARVTYTDGTFEDIKNGQSSRALTYEIDSISRTLLSESDLTSLSLTKDVNELINWAAEEWHMSWVFKD